MSKWLFLFVFFSSSVARAMTCKDGETELVDLQTKLVQSSPEGCKKIADEMIEVLALCSSEEDFMTYPFERVTMFKPFSQDANLRIFTWNYLGVDGNMNYFGCLHFRTKKEGHWWVKLEESTELEKFATRQFSNEKWCGTVYYAIAEMPKKKNKRSQYALLGFQGNNALTNKKIIEIVNIGNKDVTFGDGVFELKEKSKPIKRFVLEYSDEATCILRYYPKSDIIVFDHLSPREPAFVDFFAEYGPDGSYDAFIWNKKKWVYLPVIDVSKYVEKEK
ncbi:MAG: hypothetical protein ACKO8Q_04510 [Bacteroidota bacterium]